MYHCWESGSLDPCREFSRKFLLEHKGNMREAIIAVLSDGLICDNAATLIPGENGVAVDGHIVTL